MKFDVFSWDEVKTNVQIENGKGQLRLLASAPAPLYVTAQGVESLAGYGTEWNIEVAEEVTFRLDAPKGVRLFRYRPFPETSCEAEGEVYTNIDRMPHESGTMAEVLRARRMLEMERRSMLKEIRQEAAIARASVRGAAPKEPAPGPSDNPPDETQPESEASE